MCEAVRREVPLPGAICVRVAASHIRVGTFQYTAANAGPEVLQRLTDHAIRRHHPSADGPLALLEAVAEAQAALVAGWMLTGFVHGVMNTDNMTISGEAIDFGPCAWMERYDPQTVFSSIDQQGRYAWGNQPAIAQWDLARFAEALLPLGAFGVEEATAVLQRFPDAFEHHWQRGMAAKLGLDGPDPERVTALLAELQAGGEDWTTAFRKRRPAPPNPLVIPRNHVLDDALSAATAGDLEPVSALIAAVRRPFDEGADARLTQPAPDTDGPFVTFCGT
jgi:serine/tyrosine/threonine adenylyltransferase